MDNERVFRKLNSSTKKKLLFSIAAFVLTISFVTLIDSAPVEAQTATSPIPTNAFLAVSPNPAGTGQQVTILMWLDKIDPTSNGPIGGRWHNFTLLITKPDGTTQTLGPFTADDAAYAYTLYTPDQIGNYTLKFSFPDSTYQESVELFQYLLTAIMEPAASLQHSPCSNNR
jgi:hypothetical protein